MIKGLYIHIPFCDQICTYCDFAKQVAKPKIKEEYIIKLLEELDYYKEEYNNLKTIYIGGGTPSSMDLVHLEKLFIRINDLIDIENIEEFTVECNPNDVNLDFIKLIKKYNVNRLSIGVQTINEKSLKILNRNHKISDIIEFLTFLKEQDFTNYNLDFIYGIPNQTKEDLLNDLSFINKYLPKHISYYSLILEEKTVLDYQIQKGEITPLDDDSIADYSDIVKNAMLEMGYNHYETSNYAFKGFESKHNLLYWNLEEYLGVGLGAASQYNNHRYSNSKSMKLYMNNFLDRLIEDYNPILEYLLMGLRLTKGISTVDFKNRFNQDLFEKYPILRKHIDNNLLVLKDNRLAFTDLGQDLANQVYLDLM